MAELWEESIIVSLAKGGTTDVTPDAVIGEYAIHKALGAVPGWTITHIKSGLAVWTTVDFRGAVRVANHLEAEQVLPAEVRELQGWKDRLTSVDRTRFIQRLSQISPRVVVHE